MNASRSVAYHSIPLWKFHMPEHCYSCAKNSPLSPIVPSSRTHACKYCMEFLNRIEGRRKKRRMICSGSGMANQPRRLEQPRTRRPEHPGSSGVISAEYDEHYCSIDDCHSGYAALGVLYALKLRCDVGHDKTVVPA